MVFDGTIFKTSFCSRSNLSNDHNFTPRLWPWKGVWKMPIFWSELGSGFGEPGGIRPTKNSYYYHYTRPNDKLPSLKRPFLLAKRQSAICKWNLQPATWFHVKQSFLMKYICAIWPCVLIIMMITWPLSGIDSRTSMCDHFSYATTSHKRPPIRNTAIFPVKALQLEPLVNDHLL